MDKIISILQILTHLHARKKQVPYSCFVKPVPEIYFRFLKYPVQEKGWIMD